MFNQIVYQITPRSEAENGSEYNRHQQDAFGQIVVISSRLKHVLNERNDVINVINVFRATFN